MDFATLDRGIALFNQRRYFDAHEVWECAWLRSEGDDKTLLQFLIQTAAALLHAERGNDRGAKSVWNKAQAKLASLPEQPAGINLEEFSLSVEGALNQARAVALPTLRRT